MKGPQLPASPWLKCSSSSCRDIVRGMPCIVQDEQSVHCNPGCFLVLAGPGNPIGKSWRELLCTCSDGVLHTYGSISVSKQALFPVHTLPATR